MEVNKYKHIHPWAVSFQLSLQANGGKSSYVRPLFTNNYVIFVQYDEALRLLSEYALPLVIPLVRTANKIERNSPHHIHIFVDANVYGLT